jgi:hypothetical protein
MAHTITLRAHGATRASEARFQVFHFAGVPGSDPFWEALEFGCVRGRSNAAEVKAGVFGSALDEGGQVGHLHGAHRENE